ncbi:MAG: integrase domain-containing protein [Gammaproteobacteria bacterium]|nr:integrase domain-containing protein [Gammaproteobacteria bacterium]
MGKRHQLVSSVIMTIKHNKEGSYRTQDDRRDSLIDIANTVFKLGYQLDHMKFLKPKHIQALVNHWKAENITPGVMKNRMSHIRWLMRKFEGKINMVPSNDELGIPKRVYVTHKDKSVAVGNEDINLLNSPLMRLSVEGSALFGMRLEESLKVQPHLADTETHLHLTKTKGKRERLVPILTPEQREWLDKAKQLVKGRQDSLIPTDVSYKTYRERFNKACDRAGISRKHGLRHAYAQRRYKELTGWDSPVKGGPTRAQMTAEQKQKDRAARLQLSLELGHSRINIVKIYCS